MPEVNEEYAKEALREILKTLHKCQTMSPKDKVSQYLYELDKLKYLMTFPNISEELKHEIGKPIKIIENYLGVNLNFE